MIKIIKDSVVNQEVDAIVNAANSSLMGGGGVDGAIHFAAGPKLDEACKKIGQCDVGAAVITPGFNLKAEYIIHTVGPIYCQYSENDAEELLSSCYISCMYLAREHNLHSIAFPCISCGVYGFPLEDATLIAIRSVRRWLIENDYNLDVTFACFTDKEYEMYNSKMPLINEDLLDKVKEYLESKFSKELIEKADTEKRKKQAVLQEITEIDYQKINSTSASYSLNVDGDINDIFNDLDESFSEMLFRKIDELGIKDSECYNRANIDRRLFSKIRSSKNYKPSKQTVIAFAIALKLSIKETNSLLKKAGYALSDSDKSDAVVKYFIKNKDYDLFKIDETLLKLDLKPISNY